MGDIYMCVYPRDNWYDEHYHPNEAIQKDTEQAEDDVSRLKYIVSEAEKNNVRVEKEDHDAVSRACKALLKK